MNLPYLTRFTLVVCTLSTTVSAQVFDSGPSDPALFEHGVINLPQDPAPDSIGLLQQLNVTSGGILRVGFGNFDVLSGAELNVYDGLVEGSIAAQGGSEVNVMGGEIDSDYRSRYIAISAENSLVNIMGGFIDGEVVSTTNGIINMSGGIVNSRGIQSVSGVSDGSVLNMNGGSFGERFEVRDGGLASITGGSFGRRFTVLRGGMATISGGTFGPAFRAAEGSELEFVGNEFAINGVPYEDDTLTLALDEVFTGTLADGTAFIIDRDAGERLSQVNLTRRQLQPADTAPIFVDSPITSGPSGLRAGQSLVLRDGGELGTNFEAYDSRIEIQGGRLGSGAGFARSEVSISGGEIGDYLTAYDGSVLNISGGRVGITDAYSGSTINISGGYVSKIDSVARSTVNVIGGEIDSIQPDRDSRVIVRGGYVRSLCSCSSSEVDILGGTIEDFLAFNGGNVKGGKFEGGFYASTGDVNFFGTEFFIDGLPISNLLPGKPLEISERNVTLSGTLADGSEFNFRLSPDGRPGFDVFTPHVNLNVYLVPEPNALPLVLLSGMLLGLAHQYRWGLGQR